MRSPDSTDAGDLAGGTNAGRDVEHALDGRGIGRVAVDAQPRSRIARRARGTGAAATACASVGSMSPPTRRGVGRRRPAAMRTGRAAGPRRARRSRRAREAVRDGPDCAGTDGPRWWDRRPVRARVRRTTRGSRGAAAASSGWRDAGLHRGQPGRGAPAEQREQHRLGLVVGGVAGERLGAEQLCVGPTRALASKLGPSASSARSQRNVTPS